MDMKFFTIDEQKRVVGVANYKASDKYKICQIPENILKYVEDSANSVEKRQLFNTSNFKANAKVTGADVYDTKVGHDIVRDKLIIKDAERNIAKLTIVGKYLMKMIDYIHDEQSRYSKRMADAYDRLGNNS